MASPTPPLLGEPLPLELVNTRFMRRGEAIDGLATPGDLADWLGRVRDRLPYAPTDAELGACGPHELVAARELRDALRALVRGTLAGEHPDAGAVATVNDAVRTAPRWRELTTQPRSARSVTAAAPIPAALGAIAAEAVELLSGSDAGLLRSCAAPGCVLVYRKDHPRRTCCSPRCSNRARAARHYARRRAARPRDSAERT